MTNNETVHKLKIKPKYFNDVCFNHKNFELRKDDRGYKVGDRIVLEEWDGDYTGRTYMPSHPIQYILRDCDGLQDGYCILGW